MNIKLITFDLDGTLWPVDEVLRKADQEMRSWIRSHVPAFDQIDTDRMNEVRLNVMATRPEIAHDISQIRIDILKSTFELLGFSSSDSAELAQGAFEILISWRNKVTPYSDVQRVLEELKTRYVLATLTNGNADVEQTALKHCFEFNLSAAQVGALKPAKIVFETALEIAKVRPHEAVHIGDHLVDDIDAANAVGMQTIWVNYDRSLQTNSASATVDKFASVPVVLRELESELD